MTGLTAKRLALALVPLILLAACNDAASDDDDRAASGTVLEGTISDAMLPVDTVQSEPPFEDPEAAKKVQASAEEGAEGAASEAGDEGEAEEAPAEEAPAAEPAPEPAD